jgi:hypothetical protein
MHCLGLRNPGYTAQRWPRYCTSPKERQWVSLNLRKNANRIDRQRCARRLAILSCAMTLAAAQSDDGAA